MRVLMISMDRTILNRRSTKPGDTLERHIRYGEALKERYGSGALTVVGRAHCHSDAAVVEPAPGLSIVPLRCRRPRFPLEALRACASLCAGQRFDLVTTQTPFDDGLVGVSLRHSFGVPLNVQMRSSFLDMPNWIRERPLRNHLFNQVGRWVSERADTIRVISEGERDRLAGVLPGAREKVRVLHPLVNKAVFDTPLADLDLAQVDRALERNGWPPGHPFFLFVGRLVAEKNLPLLLGASAMNCWRPGPNPSSC